MLKLTPLLLLAACGDTYVLVPAYEVVDLGKFTTDTNGLVAVPWEAPEGAVFTEVFCGPYGYETTATAANVTSPDGTTVFDSAAPFQGGLRVGVFDDMLPVLVPVSPNLQAVAGEWSMTLSLAAADLPATVSCSAISGIGQTAAENRVDVHIVFVGVDGIAPGMTALAAESDDTVQAVMSGLDELWVDLGLSVGEVRYSDFSGDVAEATSVDDPTELGNLLRTIDDGEELTFFFVRDLVLADDVSLLGRSGGTPGVAGQGGTSKSGVVINVANVVDSPEQVSLTMAHEAGHFFGLFHPTELDLSGNDPLDDTPECIDPEDDGCAENVMWPNPQVGTATTFSREQGWVVAQSPIVRPG